MHPLRIGSLYGLIAAVVAIAGYIVNHTVFDKNLFVGFIGGFVLPLVAIYLAGHFAGRHERYQLSTAVTGGLRATLHGTSSGVIAGLVFLILTQFAPVLNNILPPSAQLNTGTILGGGVAQGAVETVVFILSLIGWTVGGALIGTVGGALGDNQAHRDLKSGKVPAGTIPPPVVR